MSLHHDPRCLIADIGGTHCRFAQTAQGHIIKTTLRSLDTAAYPTLAAALEHYLNATHSKASDIARACFALAGPIDGQRYTLTNGHWQGDVTALAAATGLPRIELINDFEAIAHGIAQLTPAQLMQITGSTPATTQQFQRGVCAVIGPGTGLGTALVVPLRNGGVQVCAGEGGHASLALDDEHDLAIAHWLLRHGYALERETLLSGPGIERLYQALCAIQGHTVQALRVHDIVAAGKQGDAVCRETLLRFCALLGSTARDLVLDGGARGGLYIAGGVVPHFAELLPLSAFRDRFEQHAKMHDYLRGVPTWLIVEPNPGLLGAAWYCQQH